VSLDDDARAELAELTAAGRLRVPRTLDGTQGPTAVLDGIEVINFASNDYLGLARDPRLLRACASAAEEAGSGVGASRLVVGNHRCHIELEAAVADWMRFEAARLFNTGYAANVGVLTTLLRAGDAVFSDALNHASIIDGCRLSRADVVVYPHRDLHELERRLPAYASRRRRVIVSESLFSMDGDLVDVEHLVVLGRRHDAIVMLDEAHAVGARGSEGRGAAEHARPEIVLGTFGKALGSFGAFVVAPRSFIDLLWNRARTFVFSTGLPAPVAAASRAAIEIVRGVDGNDRRTQLAANASRLRGLLSRVGGIADGAIAPFLVGDDREVMRWSHRLFEKRIFVQGIRPPTVPAGTARLRIGISASHTAAQIEALAKALR
jgi:8-amino-7-oxononanoate synthase